MNKHQLRSCIFCNRQLNCRPEFELHMRVHTQERPYNCKKCDKQFKNIYHLNTHKKIYGAKTIKCEICDKRLRQLRDLKLHMRKHTGEKPYKCEKCPRKFARLESLKYHIILHTGVKPYKCDTCSKKIVSASNLKAHILRHHSGRRLQGERKSCLFCHMMCCDLESHLRTHTGEKPYYCSVCSSSFAHRNSLKDHMTIHTKDKNYQCNFCGKKFARPHTLRVHLNVHTGKNRVECNLCRKIFSNERTLTRHIWTHTGERPYKCQDCQKDFREYIDLKKHRLKYHFEVASNQYVFQVFYCVFCQNKFFDKRDCFQHIIGHILEKAYSCKFCDLEFSRKGRLRAHMNRVHKKTKQDV